MPPFFWPDAPCRPPSGFVGLPAAWAARLNVFSDPEGPSPVVSLHGWEIPVRPTNPLFLLKPDVQPFLSSASSTPLPYSVDL